MLFPKTLALLLLPLIQPAASIPTNLEDRETACIALGNCGGPPPPPPPAPVITPAPAPVITPAPAPTFGCEHKADPDGGLGYCPAVGAGGWCVCSDSSTYGVTTDPSGLCGYTTTPAGGPTTLASTNCAAASTTGTATSSWASSSASTTGRNKCSPKECPKLCDLGNSTAKRSFPDFDVSNSESESSLDKRFYENAGKDQFPYQLLSQSYTRNICPSSPLKNTFIWKPFSDTAQSAAGLQGLSGCTTIFVLSSKGAFSSHIWESDTVNNPPRDLETANYKDTMSDLANGISNNVPSGALAGGEAWIILPTDPENTANLLYPQEIVDAIQNTVQQATGITATQTRYSPLDYGTSTELGTSRRGTAIYQYDPKFADPNNENKVGKAYRIYSESELLSEKRGF